MNIPTKILAIAAAAASFLVSHANAETIYGVTVFRDLITFDSANPGTILSTVPITGLTGQDQFESVRKIDFRPSTGELYAVGNAPGGIYRLYTINPSNGVATRIGGNVLLNPPGSSFGFNFNPVTDQIRIVADDDQNVRYDPTNAALIAGDTPLAYASTDPNFGANPNVVTGSYSNSVAGATNSALYDIDSTKAILAQQSPSNSGQLFTLGPLGITIPNYIDGVNLDIAPGSGIAYLAVSDPGGAANSTLYTVNLSNGAATLLGEIGLNLILNSIAVSPEPKPALPQIGFFSKTGPSLPGTRIRFRASTDPGLDLRIQATTTPDNDASWADGPTANNGLMTENDSLFSGAGNYTLVTAQYLRGAAIYFRAISSKDGFSDGKSDPLGPFDLTVPGPPQHGGLSPERFSP